jgi:hypothetical protein
MQREGQRGRDVPMPEDERSYLERAATLLVDHELTGVRYIGWWDTDPDGPESLLEYVELRMEDGAALLVSAEPTFGPYGISLREGTYPARELGICVLNATDHGGWPSLLGRRITAVHVHWATIAVPNAILSGKPFSTGRPAVRAQPRLDVSVSFVDVRYPADLEITTDGAHSVVLTASGWDHEGGLIADVENVAVVFGDTEAQRLGLARWRSR